MPIPESVRHIEALLFLAGEAVSYQELSRLVQCPLAETRALVTELQHSLAGHALTLVITDTHVQLTTSPAVSKYVATYIQGATQDISAAAIETLAIIAYRGPVTRYDVDAIRGIDSRRMIRQLVARGLIHKTVGEGRVPHYSITPEFLQHLGVTSRDELPQFDELSSHEKIEQLLKREDE